MSCTVLVGGRLASHSSSIRVVISEDVCGGGSGPVPDGIGCGRCS